MADHLREQITVAAVAALTGLATTGADVFRDRDTLARPLTSDEIPGLTIEDGGDPSEILTLGVGRILQRQMRLTVTAHVKAVSGYSSQLNQILKEVEIAMAGASLAGAKYATLAQVGARDVSEASDQPVVRQAFGFDVLYFTVHDTPDVAR